MATFKLNLRLVSRGKKNQPSNGYGLGQYGSGPYGGG